MAVKCDILGCIRRAGPRSLCGQHAFEHALAELPPEPLFDDENGPVVDVDELGRMTARTAILALLRAADQELTLRELQSRLRDLFSPGRIREAVNELVERREITAAPQKGIALNGQPVDRFQLVGVYR